MKNHARFRDYVAGMTRLVENAAGDEAKILNEGSRLLGNLVSHDDWLPDEATRPHPQYYQQYLLYCDPLERFSVVSFVWGPGQTTPVHDHTVWGMVGMLRGAELCKPYSPPQAGKRMAAGETKTLKPGEVEKLSPRIGDVHQVSNALADQVSISIHVYGANIGAVKRHVFDPANGGVKDFVSGYSSPLLPNFWDRSADVRAELAKTA
jgi:predicted metal-dependent enzyme (double-stranded beta helix superfamily)